MRRLMTPINILGLLLLAITIGVREVVSRPPTAPSLPPLQLEAVQPQSVTLYFSNAQVDGYVKEQRTLQVEGKSPGKVAQAQLGAWVRGPLSGKGLRVVPQGSTEPDVWVRGPHFVVNLPRSYAALSYGLGGERLIICTLTRTLLETGGKDVLFLVGGQGAPTLLGHLDLRRPWDKVDCAE
ncbi:GerMN domain-containing protein [Deinococcus sp.]|uniref:GerMN domain-containing protein n=1 Tax=Deinococcus sp. TaxID=47478 RepID=UPI0025F1E57C|nr:GerMN domain-containing protein [Deinococcus sp.]